MYPCKATVIQQIKELFFKHCVLPVKWPVKNYNFFSKPVIYTDYDRNQINHRCTL